MPVALVQWVLYNLTNDETHRKFNHCPRSGTYTYNNFLLYFTLLKGLDPASPFYSYANVDVRLDPTDAKFVDVIHTDMPLYGTPQSVGHIDFFPNGGADQPGCNSGIFGKLSFI